jgi:hypothetical protein
MGELKKSSGSWKTTGVGVAAFVGALGYALVALWDGDVETVPNWEVVVGAFVGMVGLIFARDNDKSSEDVGAGGDIGPR